MDLKAEYKDTITKQLKKLGCFWGHDTEREGEADSVLILCRWMHGNTDMFLQTARIIQEKLHNLVSIGGDSDEVLKMDLNFEKSWEEVSDALDEEIQLASCETEEKNKIRHNELIKGSDCGGMVEFTGRNFSWDVYWTLYKCLKCGCRLQVVSPLHNWNTEVRP